ncbi:hypothetical protein [Subtercola sp. YIM 133946]|uniref:hypothetical protein n=1 Tax=Subtercola sp. YIM 133946 TaxID=3118909 RepID=UPI002F9244C4
MTSPAAPSAATRARSRLSPAGALELTLLLDATGVTTLGMLAARAGRRTAAEASVASGLRALAVVGVAGLALAACAVRFAIAGPRAAGRQRRSFREADRPAPDRPKAERPTPDRPTADRGVVDAAQRLIVIGAIINTIGSLAAATRSRRDRTVLVAATALLVGGDALSATYSRSLRLLRV